MNLLVYAKPALQYMNAILMTITEIAKSIARTKAEIDNIDYESEFASFGDSVEDVNDAVEELNNSLTTLALDRLNIIGGSSNVSNVSGLSVEGNILNALKEYNMNLDKIQTKSRTISNNILSWLGYTQNINDETGEVEWKLENSNANINKIFTVAKSLLVVLGAIGASKAISNISGMFGQISNPKVGLVITGLVTLLSYFTYLYKNNEDLKSSLDESFSKIKSNLQSIFETLKPVISFINDFVSIELKSAAKGIEAITSLLSGDFKGAWEAIKESFSVFFNETFSLIFGKEKWEEFKNTIKKVFTEDIPNFVKTAWESIRKFLFETIPNFFTKTIPNFFIDAINKVIKGLNGLINKTPSWLKGGIIGNATIPEIPRLAKGGVLSSPTLFMGGEYNNAKTNPEIVTPQNIMRETIVESMLPLVNAILQGDKNLIKAIENKKTDVYLNSRKVSEAMYDDFESVATRKGKILFGQ